MAKIYRAPFHPNPDEIKGLPAIFLGGSIEMGKAEEWQAKIENELEDLDVVIFNPRRLDFDATQKQSADNPYIREQIEWERKYLDYCHILAFYFAPNTVSPITLFEVGVYTHKHQLGDAKIVLYCPEGYARKANVDINCKWDGIPQSNSWEDFIKDIKTTIASY
jgi:hypothetical protein